MGNSRLSEADWTRLLERYRDGETARALAQETGVLESAVRRQARNRGMRQMDHPDRPRPPAARPDDYRDPRSKLTEGEWKTLLRRMGAGEPARVLAAEYGVHVSSIAEQARNRGLRKKDQPDAVYAGRTPAGPPPEGCARARLGFDFDPDNPGEGAKAALRRAAEAAAEGRVTDFMRLGKAAREAGRLERDAARAARDPSTALGRPACAEGEERDGGAPLVLRKAQRPPEGEWRTWLFLGGRGAGKTLAGARWLADRATAGARLALVGPTLHDVREVMIEGPSGLRGLAGGPRPWFEASRRRLVWPSGAVAYAFSAEEPERLRGPQFSAAWADEFCAWPKAEETLALLRLGLRLGDDPRLAVTTTPKPLAALRRLIAEPSTTRSDAPTADNAANLAPAFVEGLEALYGGTRLAAQELGGLLLEAADGALWRRAELERCRGARPPRLDAVVVAVDPPAGGAAGAAGEGSACGMVVAGRLGERAYVLADLTERGLSPNAWATRAGAAAAAFGASRIVAEANQGGDMVRSVLATAAPPCAVKLVHASRGKRARAEPVAALYEQGRVTHCGAFEALEEEMAGLGCGEAGRFDRADALVWALSELMLERPAEPRLRLL